MVYSSKDFGNGGTRPGGSLKDFPLVIEEIKLGPNCPNVETNQLQVELMIKELRKNLRLVRNKGVVETSGIETYRMR